MSSDEKRLKLQDYFINQLTTGGIYLLLAKGKAKYKMDRGSFTTHDFIYDRHKLTFKEKDGENYIFASGKIQAEISLEMNQDGFKMHFKAPEAFNRFTLHFESFKDEHIYGGGEQFTHLDLKGKDVPIWVSEHQQVKKIAKKFLREKLFGVNPDYKAKYKDHQTYYSSPSFLSSQDYFVYVHEDSYGCLHFKKNETLICFRQVPTSISFLFGNSHEDILERLSKFVGIQPPLPDFVSQGAIIASQGGSQIMLERYEKLKKEGAKISGIWCQDWSGQIVTEFGSQVYWNWEVDDKLYPNLKETIKKLNAEGVKFLGYINTFLKEDTHLYNEAKKLDYLVKNKKGEPYLIKSTTFLAGIVDLTNPSAYNWYKEIIKTNMIDLGLSGWMADFGEYLPTDAVIYAPSAEKAHNRWPTLWAKCNYDAIRERGKEKEIFTFSRAAYGHTTKYVNSMWNGDQHVDYSDEYGIGSVIPATLSMACSGVGIAHSDIGGYTTVLHMKRSVELIKRWSELNIFFPVYRCHEGNRPKVNAQAYSDEVKEEFSRNSRLFAALKPYRDHLYSAYQEKGLPFIRPLFIYEEKEEAYKEQKEFMCGEDLLISPVLREGVKEKKVHLPEGEWIQLFTEEKYEGGDYLIKTPLGLPIAFYRADSQFKELFKELKKEIEQ
ncbi:MAG: alpha-glucosidase [Bacilli bacterium]|jgi:alpha-glucosidase|nr:alpha-glucosidase [Bacilli bacterium]